MKKLLSFALFFALVTFGFGQATAARVGGTVTDTTHAVVPATTVQIADAGNGLKFTAATDARGYWTIPAVPPGTYTVTATHQGFKAQTVANVKVDAGVPATVNLVLTVGAMNETVEVTSGAEVVQTDTAAVNSTIEGKQIHDLPFTSRNATELIATQPGTASGGASNGGGVRYSLINGLPQSAINITMDGVNIQDNDAKSSDGVFNAIMPRSDAVEEVTVSSAAGNADSLGEGAVQIKFVTRAGTNQWHGDLFEQNRNRALESNYYFNSVNGLPRDQLNLNEFGGRIGGPVIKNKLFIFFAMEAFRLPQSYLVQNQQWLTPAAQTGIFTYKDSGGNVQTMNLYQNAALADAKLPASVRQYPTTPDPTLAATYAQIQTLTSANGGLISRIASNNDYNRGYFSSLAHAVNNRNFPTGRLDYNLNPKNHFDIVGNYQTNARTPDALNGTVAILPGTGTVLGSPDLASQIGDAFSYVGAWRTVLTPNLTNEASLGFVGGTTWFSSGLLPTDFTPWKGVIPAFGGYITNPYRSTYASVSRRNSPVKNFLDTLTWVKGNHVMTFGGSFTQVNLFQASSGSQIIPTFNFGTASGDPDNTGSTSMFTTTTMPGSSPTQRSDAASLYAILTGRISSITSSASQSEADGTYGSNFTITRDQQREFSFYGQDSWRITNHLSFNYGLRWEKQNPFENLNGFYTAPGLAGMYGASGVGNLFQPGTLTGVTPTFQQVQPGVGAYRSFNKAFDPTVGFAYQLENHSGLLGAILGHNAVVRGGYSISNIREGMGAFTGVLGRNPGINISTSVDPVNTPGAFGPAGSVEFRDPSFPSQQPTTLDPTYPKPSYPIAVQTNNSLYDFNPNLKMEYVQSWNFGLQRELGANTVIEARYTGNHGTDLWRTENLNEVNVFENGFLSQFEAAQKNLAIARAVAGQGASNNFGNQGLAGQQDIPIISTALGTTNDQTTANQLSENAAGATANAIATNTTRMGRLTAKGYPTNLFVVNPATNGSVNLTDNSGASTYNALQVELRRRLSHGLQVQGSYTYAKALTNTNSSVQTLRDLALDKGPSGSDIRNDFKVNWIYALPVGPNQMFLNHAGGFAAKVLSGWEFSGVGRLQSGSPEQISSGTGFATFDQNDPGAVLHNITQSQLQADMHITKTGDGTVYYLPQDLVNNTMLAYQITTSGGGTFDPSKPYIGPPAAGTLGNRIYLYGPWLSKWDVGLAKTTTIHESMNLELRAQALNVFNTINFLLPTQGVNAVSSTFGQTTNAFRDFNNTNDPGARTIEFVIKLNF